MKDIVVIYHKADYDGIFCREIARKYLGDEAEYIGWDYGDPVPVEVDSATWAHNPTDCPLLYMLDISIDELMAYPGLVWIDHHKTAIEKYGNVRGYRGAQIDGVAACRLAWQWFFGDNGIWQRDCVKDLFIGRHVTEPRAVRLAGEYDVWDKRDNAADLLQLGLKAMEPSLEWDKLLSTDHDEYVKWLVEIGLMANAYKKQLDAEIIRAYGFDLEWEGLTFLTLNTARCNSLSFESGIESHHDALLAFRFDGVKYTVSLYGIPANRADLDLSEIAKKYGGGGHKHACGFQCSEPFFLRGLAK